MSNIPEIRVSKYHWKPLDRLLCESLTFDFVEGGVSCSAPGHTSGLRVLPVFVFSYAMQSGLRIYSNGDQFMEAMSGRAVFAAPDIPHKIDIIGHKNARSTWFHGAYCVLGVINLLSLFQCPTIIKGSDAQRAYGICRKMIGLQVDCSGDANFNVMTQEKKLGFEFLEVLLKLSRPKARLESFLRYSERIQSVIEFIREQMHRPMELAELSKKAGVSQSRLHDIFQQSLGFSPMDFVKQQRLKKSKITCF